MYEQLFAFIFQKINETLDIKHVINGGGAGYSTSKNTTVIGVLDIYGFEIFENNGLEYIFILN